MLDQVVPDLTFPKLNYGTHQVPWDLRVLLYKDAAKERRDLAEGKVRSGKFGRLQISRLPLVKEIHEQITTKLVRGYSHHTSREILYDVWSFYAWADSVSADLSLASVKTTFRNWTEWLLHRVRIVKNLSHRAAYDRALALANLIAPAIRIGGNSPGRTLMSFTRLRWETPRKKVLGTKADKADLEATFRFGHFLADVCASLSVDALRGPLPIQVTLGEGKQLPISGFFRKAKLALDREWSRPSHKRRREAQSAPLTADVSIVDDSRRRPHLTLRVQAELLIFIAQTGMNLSQACQMNREKYRWQTDGEDLIAYRVYKGRRGGEAIFRCFKAYRAHWERYISWLDSTGWSKASDKLFPFIYSGKIPMESSLPQFAAVRDLAAEAGIQQFGAKSLRKARVNWLLRRTGDPELSADMSAHTKQTMLTHYEKPHHQKAAAEVTTFHLKTDPTLESPGPGDCAGQGRKPTAVADKPPEAPEPDCISPEGCIFCEYHRDVLSADYCWKLATHARIKALEVTLDRPPSKRIVHPANTVIDRINAKLFGIAKLSTATAQWVRDGQDAVRAGRYHPRWDGQIQLLEIFA